MRGRGVEIEPTVKMGHASAAIERRAGCEQAAAGEERQAVTPRGQMNEAIHETRGLGIYIERGREWLREVGDRLRQGLTSRSMAGLVQGAARTMRAELDRGGGAGLVPALDQAPQRQPTPALDQARQAQDERDQQRELQRGRDGPEIGFGR